MAKIWINHNNVAVPLGFKAVRVGGAAVTLNDDHVYLRSTSVPPAGSARSLLDGMQGTYWPSLSSDNVGLPDGTVLTTGPTGDYTISSGGTYENLDIAGFLFIRTSQPVIIRKCRIRGWNKSFPNGGGDTGLIQTDWNSATNLNVIVEDCDLIPDFPSPWVNGVFGRGGITVRRCRIRNCVDGFVLRNLFNRTTGLINANIYANYVYDFAYFTPDYANSGQRANTHNDGMQVNFGNQIDIVGNVFIGNGSPDAGTPPYGIGTGSGANNPDGPDSLGRGINITGGTGNTADVTIRKNRFDNFQVALSVPGVSPSVTDNTIVIEDNEFGPNMPTLNTSGSKNPQHYQIQIGVDVAITGFPAGAENSNANDTVNGNKYQVGGAPAVIRRGSF